MKNLSLITNNPNLARIFPNAPLSLTGRTNRSKTFWSELRSLPNLEKNKQTLVYSDIQTFSFSRFLERQSRLSDKKTQIEAPFLNNNKCLLFTCSISIQNIWSLEGFSLSQSNSRKILLSFKSMELTQKCKKGLSQIAVDGIHQLKTSVTN